METWFWILGWSLSILTYSGYGFIIFLVCRRRRLRTKTNAFIVSLAVAGFSTGLTAFPPLFVCEAITGCDPKAFLASRMDYLRWLFGYASVTNLCCLVLEQEGGFKPKPTRLSLHLPWQISVLDRYFPVVQPLNYLLFITRERVPQIIFLSWALSVLVVCPDVVIWLAFNDNRSRSLLLNVNVIGTFLLTHSFALRCSFIFILKDEKPCDDKEYKVPLLKLNSAINPVVYAVFKRDKYGDNKAY
ncbi:dopamine receptor 2-like [Stylophora pistillata]|uniref:dopamine receptor 2-like n=1 Tax=Stylophora pistillata TaxID=50429 RepID=UPI000C03F3F8|nr:dopamine receptor 2-like [Stylophora pistillata]